MRLRRLSIGRFASFVVLAFFAVRDVAASPGYYRFPDLHGEFLVFAAEGDLWLASDRGTGPRRLTHHPGTESHPRFSPDGTRIAFSAEYDGNTDVFVIPVAGGEPVRLTWHPTPDRVIAWTPDGFSVLFRSAREHPHGATEIFTVAATGGEPERLPLGWAAWIDVDPSSGLWAFNRSSWEDATWKRYRGGMAPTIWVGDPVRRDFRQITDSTAIDAYAMWHGGRIWFLSDLGGTANVWSMLPDGTERRRHTSYDGWDARMPGMAPDGRIALVVAADIHIFDPRTERDERVAIDLPSDRPRTRTRYADAARTISWLDLSPDGTRLAVTTRGEVFSVPVKAGVTLPVTRGSAARESWASFDSSGNKLFFVSDATREEEIRVVDAWGRGETRTVVPAGTSRWHFPPALSPDGKRIAWGDQSQTLWTAALDGGRPERVDHSDRDEIREYAWSPDGRWLAYAKSVADDYESIFVFDTRDRRTHAVTGPTTNDWGPAWDPQGRYLYFLSDRATNPLLGVREWQNIEARSQLPYAIVLGKDVHPPFAEREGLPGLSQDDVDKPKASDSAKDPDPAPKPVEIDFEGVLDRVVPFPVERGIYEALRATKEKVWWVSSPLRGMAERPGLFEDPPPSATLIAFDLESKEAKPFVSGISGYSLAAKADKVAIQKQPGEICVFETKAPPEGDLSKSKVALDGIVVELAPRDEWDQIFHEAWRHMREFYWDPGMGGVDWSAERARYANLLPRVATRDELEDLLGELIGELGTSHTYVFGGDPGVAVTSVPTGLLGADLERVGDAYRIRRILRSDPADQVRSALAEPGAGIAEGDYILAVNHQAFVEGRTIESSLAQRAGKRVVLSVHSKPSLSAAREVDVRALPPHEEARLRYADQIRRNREYVAEKTQGKIGYLHLPDMWQDGLIAFNTWFYPQLDREGLIVDVRWNRGGAVSQMIVERLRRKVVSFDRARGGGVETYPHRVLNGPFVVLTNEFAGSDGDIFPMAVQIEGLAPVIGRRSWGGVIGIRMDKRLVDGGLLSQPEFAWWDSRQGWALENRGVVPDIDVQNLPQDLARGEDAQLDRAIAEVLRLHAERPPVRPAFEPAPDRSRQAFRDRELRRDK